MSISVRVAMRPELHSHNTGHWRKKAAPIAQARFEAKMLAMAKGNKPIKGRVTVDYRFTVPNRIRRDVANMIQSCKAFIDGVVDAKMIEGDHWEVLSIGNVTVTLGSSYEVELVFYSSQGNG